MKKLKLVSAVIVSVCLFFACSDNTANAARDNAPYTLSKKNTDISKTDVNDNPGGIHFKIDGKQYDIVVVTGISNKDVGFVVYNAGLPGFPDTTITLSAGAGFTGSTGVFKSDGSDKGCVFGFNLGNMQNMIGYSGGKNDDNTVNTSITINVTSFSMSGTDFIKGNVTAQGTFSGSVYDFKNKKNVALTDGTFNIHPL